jgi:hypothetical protein
MTTLAEHYRAAIRDAILKEVDMAGGIEAFFSMSARAALGIDTCPNPTGHDFMTSCGETKCRYCPKIAWR